MSDHDAAQLYPLTNVPTKYQLPTPYGFRDIARTRFYRSRSLRQGQRSNQGNTTTLHTYTPLTNVPTKYQLPTPHAFRDIARTRFYRSRSLRQGQRSNPQTMCLPNINFLHLAVLTYNPDKPFFAGPGSNIRPSRHYS